MLTDWVILSNLVAEDHAQKGASLRTLAGQSLLGYHGLWFVDWTNGGCADVKGPNLRPKVDIRGPLYKYRGYRTFHRESGVVWSILHETPEGPVSVLGFGDVVSEEVGLILQERGLPVGPIPTYEEVSSG